jgi:hypothetical protein
VWQLRSRSPNDVLRLGRVAAERWREVPGGLSLLASEPVAFDAEDRMTRLPLVIESLFREPENARVTVVLESAWLPFMLAEVGPSVWRKAEVAALLRHRLAMLHGNPVDPVAAWDVRVDHRPGERWGLGYGFSPLLREALADGAARTGKSWSALMPAVAWGWQRMRSAGVSAKPATVFAWQEQDRTLLCSFEARRLVALHPAGGAFLSVESLADEVAAHLARSGLPERGQAVVATSWSSDSELPSNSLHTSWYSMAAPTLTPTSKAAA